MTNCPPYRPFRGIEPPHFVDPPDDEGLGWAPLTKSALDAYVNGPSDPRFHRLVASEPALGKTACLRSISRLVEERLGWTAVFHRCCPGQIAFSQVAVAVEKAGGRMGLMSGLAKAPGPAGATSASTRRPVPLRHEAVPATWAADRPRLRTVPSETSQPWSFLKLALEEAGRRAAEQRRGVLVVLDDVDVLVEGVPAALGHLAYSMSSAGLPVAFLMSAGLPLAERFARAGNFAGSLWQARLQHFDHHCSREALVVPAADRDVGFDEEALELACAAARGSPLEVQRLGFAAWPAASGRNTVVASDVKAAIGLLEAQFAS
ncbi:MAG TPA: hypothetical protein VME20_06405 [Acidimicrobiales bacterium]|nr:hypothetical protein [Acidimicrobiales bacterium]